jgi:hypothetical protein
MKFHETAINCCMKFNNKFTEEDPRQIKTPLGGSRFCGRTLGIASRADELTFFPGGGTFTTPGRHMTQAAEAGVFIVAGTTSARLAKLDNELVALLLIRSSSSRCVVFYSNNNI